MKVSDDWKEPEKTEREPETEKEVEMETDADGEREDSMFLPPRSALFPSNKAKITRYYYATLLVIFIGLVVALAVWGMHEMGEPL